jgi:uncharacterized BrkB/YihY/UPF0761 family membrane protein
MISWIASGGGGRQRSVTVMLKWLYGPILVAKADRLGTYAAALAYSFVLSMIPFLVVTFTLGTELTHKNLAQAYGELLVDILPGEGERNDAVHGGVEKIKAAGNAAINKADTGKADNEDAATTSQSRDERVRRIVNTLQGSSHRHWAVVGYVLAFYTSFNLMTQIVSTLLFIFDDPRRAHEWSWAMVLKTVSIFVVWMLLLLLFATCSVVFPVIKTLLTQAHLSPILWSAPLGWLSYLVGVASLFGAFFLTFLMVPTKRYRWSQVRNGSLVASLGLVLCSWVFANVLPTLWRTNAVYEALGSVVITLLWAQACAWCVIIGACSMVRFPGKR